MDQSQTFPSIPDNRLRLLRNSCIFCLFFLCFWLPYGIFQFPLDLPREVLPEILEIYLDIYFKFLRNTNYVLIGLNPVILFLLSYDLLKHIPYFRCERRFRLQIWLSSCRFCDNKRLKTEKDSLPTGTFVITNNKSFKV